jgi:TPP-dependent pyruvate/acetoin dehydrogenase alpha subunit
MTSDKEIPGGISDTTVTMTLFNALYRSLYLIRCFEETVLENFPKGVFFGTTHTYLGQEADAVGVLSHLKENDIVFSNHRCHGHFLAYGGDPRALFGELMGRATGVCGGRGGSQHLQWRNFYSNGVLGGSVPAATGMALAEKLKGNPSLVVTFLGDGTLGEGVVYESLNMAALWKAPILYVVENNHIAQTTPIELAVAGSPSGRFSAFGLPVTELDTSDVLEISTAAKTILSEIRQTHAPQALILNTCRFGPHSKGDDTRPPERLANLRAERDPLTIHGSRLSPVERAEIESLVNQHIEAAFQQAMQDPFPTYDLENGA